MSGLVLEKAVQLLDQKGKWYSILSDGLSWKQQVKSMRKIQ